MLTTLTRRTIGIGVAALLTLSACGSSSDGTTEALLDVDATMESIGEVVDAYLERTGAPGVTLAILFPAPDSEAGYVERSLAVGYSNIADDLVADPSHHYRFGSITKTMTSAVVLQLVDEGLIELDAPVSTYLGSGWAKGYEWNGADYGDRITIRQILNHTDGFAEYAFDPGFYIEAGTRLTTPYEPEEIVEWAVRRGPQYEPGNGYLYNTVGHVVAGLVIEEVTGKTAEEMLRTRLFEPAEADDAYLAPTKFAPEDGVAGYVQGALKAAYDLLPSFAPYRADAAVGDFYDVTVAPQDVPRSAGWTGGGIEAQADDIARIFREIFTQTLSTEMLTEFLKPSAHSEYGLGVNVGPKAGITVYSHGGGVPGFRSEAVFAPDLDVTVAVSTNIIEIDPDIGRLTDEIMAIIVAALES